MIVYTLNQYLFFGFRSYYRVVKLTTNFENIVFEL